MAVADETTAGAVIAETTQRRNGKATWQWNVHEQTPLKPEDSLPPMQSFNPVLRITAGNWQTYSQQVLAALNEASRGQTAAEQAPKRSSSRRRAPTRRSRCSATSSSRISAGMPEPARSAAEHRHQGRSDSDRWLRQYDGSGRPAPCHAPGRRFEPRIHSGRLQRTGGVAQAIRNPVSDRSYVRQCAGPPARRLPGHLPERHEPICGTGHHSGGRPFGAGPGPEQAGNGRRRPRRRRSGNTSTGSL